MLNASPTVIASSGADTPEDVIRRYYEHQDTGARGQAGACEKAYNLLSPTWRGDLARFVEWCSEMYTGINIISIETIEQFAARQGRRAPTGDQASRPDAPRYVVIFEVHYKPGKAGPLNDGQNIQMLRLGKVNGIWSILEIGF
jgi:hypothetical protein